MTSAPPHTSAPRAASDQRWSLVALAAAGLTVGYLAAHGARGLIDLIAAAIAGLGLLAVAVAAPRIARDFVRVRMSSAPGVPLGVPLTESPIRWLVPQIAGVLATSTMLIGALSVANLVDGDRAAHAVALAVVAGNALTLLGHLVPLPGFPGWSLLLVCLQLLGTRASRRTSLAATVARIGVSLIAAFIVVVGVVARQPLMLPGSVVLLWYGWSATTGAVASDAVSRLLAGVHAGDLARPVVDQYGENELVSAGNDPEDCDRLSLVVGRAGLLGMIGPRQIRRSARQRWLRAADVMVPLTALHVSPATLPADQLMPQIARFGFALVWARGGLAYVDEADVIKGAFAADIRRRVGTGRAGSAE